MMYPNFNITIAVHVCIGSYSDSFTGVYLLVVMVSVAELPWDYLLFYADRAKSETKANVY